MSSTPGDVDDVDYANDDVDYANDDVIYANAQVDMGFFMTEYGVRAIFLLRIIIQSMW